MIVLNHHPAELVYGSVVVGSLLPGLERGLYIESERRGDVAEEDQVDLDELHRQQTRAQSPGGAAARGPQTDNPGGFDPDALVPPYEGRKEPTGEQAEAGYKAFRPDEHAPPPGEGREISEEERHGVDATDTTAATPLGVGESKTTRGEDLAADDPHEWDETGEKGQAQRPYGKPGTDKSDSVGAQDNIDPDSPVMPAGDQGG